MDKKGSNTEKKEKRPGRVKRRLIRLMLSFLGIILILQVALYYFSDPFIRTYLKDKINEESGGVYKLEFEKININVIGLGFKISELKIEPKEALIDKFTEDSTNYYKIYFPEFNVGGIGLYDLYKKRELNIGIVSITDPKVDLKGSQKSLSADKQVQIYKDVYPTIKKHFTSFSIDKLELINGAITFSDNESNDKSVSTAGDIFITLNGVRIDSTGITDAKRLFFADDIDLEIEDYRLKLSDGIHMLEAEEIKVSTSNSAIYAKKLWLLPGDLSDTTIDVTATDFYDIYIPELNIQEADIYRAYFDKILNIEIVNFSEPEIRFITKKKLAYVEVDSKKTNLYGLVSEYLDKIIVNDFEIDDGKFSIGNDIEQSKPSLHAENINVKLKDFLLDEYSSEDTERVFYAKGLEVDIDRYSMDLTDDIHTLAADAVSFSTFNSVVTAGTVSLKSKRIDAKLARQTGQEFYNLDVPKLTLQGVDFAKVYNLRDLVVEKLIIGNPDVRLSNFVKYNRSKTVKSKSSIYKLISDFVKSIAIEDIELQDGRLAFANYRGAKKDTVNARKITFNLQNFLLDSLTQYGSSRIFYADNIDFQLGNYLMKLSDDLHVLRAKNVGISTARSRISAYGIELFPIPVKNINRYLERSGRSVLFNIKIPSVVILGADIRKAYFWKILNINTISIEKPTVELNNHTYITRHKRRKDNTKDDLYALFEDYLQSINISTLNLNNGFFNVVTKKGSNANTVVQNDVSIVARNFVLNERTSLDRNRIFYSDNIDVKLNNYVINLPDGVHVLKTKEVGISTSKSEIYLKSSQLYPQADKLKALDIPAFYNVQLPYISMKGVDINKLYFKNILEIDNIVLDGPDFTIVNQLEIKGKNRFVGSNRKRASMPAKLKSIKIKDFDVNNGKLSFGNLANNKRSFFSHADLSLNLKGFLLDSIILNNNNRILYADDIEVKMKNYSINLPDSIHKITARDIFISSGKKKLKAENFRLYARPGQNNKKLLGKTKKNMLYNINFPDIELNGVDLEKAFLQKNYTVKSAVVKSPDIKLTSYGSMKKNKTEFDPKIVLEQLLTKQLKVLNINRLDFNNGNFEHTRNDADKQKVFALKRVSGFVKNFNLNNASRKKDNRLFYSDDIDLKIKNYTYKLPDSLYILKTNEIGVSLARSTIYFDNIKLIPRFGKYEFSKHLGYQKDRIEMSIKKAELNQFNFKDYLLKEQFKSGQVNIFDLNVHTFRDKRLPFPSSQRPLMPQQFLRDFKQYLKFDQMQIKGGSVVYEEFVEDGQKIGRVSFENLSAKIKNINNDPVTWRKDDLLTIDAQADLMGKGRIKAIFSSNIFDRNNRFSFSGTINAMDLTEVNPMLENVAYVSVKSGFNENLRFSFRADNDHANGRMHFRYNDLKISVIKKKTGNTGGFASFLANTFVINNKNPVGKNLRVGTISFKRDKKRSIFNYLWKSILSGLKPSLGINEKNKKDKEDKASVTEN